MDSDDELAWKNPFVDSFAEFAEFDDRAWHMDEAPLPQPKQADKWTAAQAVSDAISKAAAKMVAARPQQTAPLPHPPPPPPPRAQRSPSPPQSTKRKRDKKKDEEKDDEAPVVGMNVMYRPGQLMQGSETHGPVVILKEAPRFGFYGYSMCGKVKLFANGALRPICKRFTVKQHENKFVPSANHVWSFATEQDPRVLLTANENEQLNAATLQLEWCGYIEGDKHKFVFVAHSAYQFYVFLTNAPRPERLILTFN